MTRKITILIITILILAGASFGIWYFYDQQIPETEPITENNQEQEIEEEHVIDLSSDVDTNDWPAFTSQALNFSIKYHPDGYFYSNNPLIPDPTESDSPSFGFDDPHAGILSFRLLNFDSFIYLKEWIGDPPPFSVLGWTEISIAQKQVLVYLRGIDQPSYRVYIYSDELDKILEVSYSTEYKDPVNKIFHAMLQTIEFKK